jgi:glucosyl-3-phosphoglycerate phosphatase
VLLRHGQTRWNLEKRFQGHTDIELDEIGHQQAAAAASALQVLAPARVVSSDLVRAMATGQPLAAALGLDLITDARLRETHGGQWEGKRDADLAEADVDLWEAWRHGADIPAGRDGESRSQVGQRVAAAIVEHANDLGGEDTLVIVTHGGSANAAIGTLLGWPVEQWATLGGLINGHWAVLKPWYSASQMQRRHSAPPADWRLAAYGVGPGAAAAQIRG